MIKDFMNRPFLGELAEGEHSATLTAWEINEEKDYVKMTFDVSHNNGTRTYVRNMFDNDLPIMFSQLRRQLGVATEDLDPKLYLNSLIKEKIPFSMWVKYENVPTRANGIRRVQNVYFIAPIQADTAVAGDMENPLD